MSSIISMWSMGEEKEDVDGLIECNPEWLFYCF